MIHIIPANSETDYSIIEELASTIWKEHYTPIIGKSQVDYMLKKYQSTHAIKEQIEEDAQYYIIRYKNSPAGYLSFYKKEKSLFLSKIYVLSALRGNGIGKSAMDFVGKQAKNAAYHKISLTVNKMNTNSIAVYKNLGFEIIEELCMDIGNGYVMDDFLMEMTLSS